MNISELARLAGVSKGAVSLALRNHPSISSATRERIKSLAERFSYIPDPTVSRVMSAISRSKIDNVTSPIAILSLWPERRYWEDPGSTLKRFYRGLVSRAHALGFRTEEFWMGDGAVSTRRMHRILTARSIEGVIILNYPRAPAVLDMDMSPFACAVVGRALVRPRLYATDHDHHQGMFQVLERLRAAGYRRPGFLLQHEVNERTMHCWATAFQFCMGMEPAKARVPLLLLDVGDVGQGDAADIRRIRSWFKKHRPDAMISHGIGIKRLIAAAGITVPEEVGYATLFWCSEAEGCAGLDLQDEVVAGRAIELVVEQLHHNQRGVPTTPETVLFPGVWRDGPSLPAKPRRD